MIERFLGPIDRPIRPINDTNTKQMEEPILAYSVMAYYSTTPREVPSGVRSNPPVLLSQGRHSSRCSHPRNHKHLRSHMNLRNTASEFAPACLPRRGVGVRALQLRKISPVQGTSNHRSGRSPAGSDQRSSCNPRLHLICHWSDWNNQGTGRSGHRCNRIQQA